MNEYIPIGDFKKQKGPQFGLAQKTRGEKELDGEMYW